MKKIYCDICGEEIGIQKEYPVKWMKAIFQDTLLPNHHKDYDLCEECSNKLKMVIDEHKDTLKALLNKCEEKINAKKMI